MKRLIASIAVLIVLTTYLMSCEKDDICSEDTPTTPGLVVAFYEYGADDITKSLADFKYWVPGSDEILGTTAQVNKITLPLRTDQDEVTWALQYNTTAAGIKTSNTDLFTIKYTRTNTYVSRACGYKTTFTLIPETAENDNPLVTDIDSKPLIREVQVVTPNIENQNEVHVKIFL